MDKPRELPIDVKDRQQARKNVECDLKYCGGNVPDQYKMVAQCSADRNCPSNGRLPSCWYGVGNQIHSMQQFYHFTDSSMSCLPCCTERSNHSKMPSKCFSIHFN